MSLFIFGSIIKSIRILKSWKADLIHAHFGVPAGAAACLISRWSGIPFLITAHLGDVPGGVPEKTKFIFQFIKPITHKIWESSTTVIAISEHTRSLIKKAYPKIESVLITNGINLLDNKEVDIHVNSVPQIAFAGRLVPQKNPLQIIRTLTEIQDLNWKAIIIGDGPLYQQIAELIEANKLGNKIKMVGWVEPDAVLDIFRMSDILFMPSLEEGLPIAGLQGLAVGLALVTSTAGSFGDLIIQNVNGNTVDIDNPAGFATALRTLLLNPQKLKKYRLASLKHAKQFDIEKILDRYENVFHSIVK